jgi:hypothetical protein
MARDADLSDLIVHSRHLRFCLHNPSLVPTRSEVSRSTTRRRRSFLARMSNSSTAAYPQTIPLEKPTAHAVGRNETVVEKKRRNSRSSKLSTKMTLMSRMGQRRERSKGGVIEKGEDLGDDETSLSFPPFW